MALWASFAVMAIVASVYWLTRPTLADDARAILQAKIDNRPDILFEYAHPYQTRQIGMSRQQFVQYWERLVAPRYARWRPEGEIQAYVERGNHQGVAWVSMRDDEGRNWEMSVSAWNTGHGGRQSLLQDLVAAWWCEFIFEEGLDPQDNTLKVAAILKGLRRDRTTLRSLGITHIPGNKPGEPAVTLDEWERRLERLLERVKQAAERRERDQDKPTTQDDP